MRRGSLFFLCCAYLVSVDTVSDNGSDEVTDEKHVCRGC